MIGNTIYQGNRTFSLQLSDPLLDASFGTQQTFSTGSVPISIASGDLNGDGRPDMVVANSSSSTVSVLINTTAAGATSATFSAQQTFSSGNTPQRVVLGDLNGDGRLDLIVDNSNASSVSILLNTTSPGASSASFVGQQTFSAGSGPFFTAIGDLNGDGKIDLVVANQGASTLSILLNTTAPGGTTATFIGQQTIAAGSHPRGVEIGDLNGDGKPDLAAANFYANTASVFLNLTTTGSTTASFSAQQTFATGTRPRAVVLGDVNGDGKADMLVGNLSGNSLSVLLNQTSPGATAASFAAQQTFAATNGPASLAFADVNGDGQPDVVTANYYNNRTGVLLNQTLPGSSTASFAAQQSFATGSQPIGLAVADINGDGKTDVLVANRNSTSASVLLNTTPSLNVTATLAAQQTFTTGSGPRPAAVADFNGDGLTDVLIGNLVASTLGVLLNQTVPGSSSVAFLNQQTFATDNGPISVATADINGDGRPDLIDVDNNVATASVLLNQTAPGSTTISLTARQTFSVGSGPFMIGVGDLNGDGLPDLYAANSTANTLSVLLNQTTLGATLASFAPQQTLAVGSSPRSVTLVDLNGDGKPDLVASNNSGASVSTLLNQTTTGSTTLNFLAQQTFAVGSSARTVVAADINGDGKPDLAAINSSNDNVSVLINQTASGATTTSFVAQQLFSVGTTPRAIALKDLNGDGRVDLAVANYASNTVSVLLNQTTPGSTTANFATQQTFATGLNPFSATVADLNRDGRPDLIATDYNATSLSVFLNQTIAVSLARATATGTIQEDDPLPTASLSLSGSPFSENGGVATVTATLSNLSAQAVIVALGFTGTASATDYAASAATITISAGQTTGSITLTAASDGLVEGSETVIVDITGVTGGTENGTQQVTATITDVPPPTVLSVVVNAASGAGNQRSMVTDVTATFSGLVTIDSGAFTLAKLASGGALIGNVNTNSTVTTVGGNTVVRLTFSGTYVDPGGSLSDGNYSLTIDGSTIHETVLGLALDGDGDGVAGGNRVDAFFRLFGDSDGDRDVDNLDYARFRSALGKFTGDASFLAYFNYDGDTDVDTLDYARFRARFGTRLLS